MASQLIDTAEQPTPAGVPVAQPANTPDRPDRRATISKSPRKWAVETKPVQDNQQPQSSNSPVKFARLEFAARQSPPPLTGAAALEDERRREVEKRIALPPLTTPNPSHTAAASLMSAPTQALSRPSDAPQVAPTAPMEPAAKAASALSMAAAGASATEDREEHSPQSSTSLAGPTVTESPTPMDVDSTKVENVPQQHDLAATERSQPGSLSYPGSLQATANLAEPSARGMSFPIPGQAQSSSAHSAGKKHKCPYCSTEFTRHHNLKSHLLTHSQEKPYVCTECQMRFRRLHDLKRHGKLHSGEKPHICPKCDRKFARGDALARHSKGAGGCAGRRSMYEVDGMDTSMGEGDESTMSSMTYENAADGEGRRQSLPGASAQPTTSDGYGAQSRTYPPAGPRPAAGSGGPYPPSTSLAGTASSSSVPNSMGSSNTANTSISSVPGGGANNNMYSQAGMTESPKPLSPNLPAYESNNAGRPRSPTASQPPQTAQSGSHVRPKLPGLSHPSFSGPNAGFPAGRATADSGNMFAQSDPSLWAYVQGMEEQMKSLSEKVVSLEREVASLRRDFDGRDGHNGT